MGNGYDEKKQFGRHTQVFQNARGGRPLGPPHTQFRDNEMRMQDRPRGRPRDEGRTWEDREQQGERGFQSAMRIDRGDRYAMRGSNRMGSRDDGAHSFNPQEFERGNWSGTWTREDEDRVLMRPRGYSGRDDRMEWRPVQQDARSWSPSREMEWNATDRNLDEERMNMMDSAQFRGKGPRNYKRSDSRIMEDVYDALTYQNDLDASDVEVSVQDAEVTLKGMVATRHEKRMAEDLAHQVRGVHDVRNELRIRREDTTAQSSSEKSNGASPSSNGTGSNGANGRR